MVMRQHMDDLHHLSTPTPLLTCVLWVRLESNLGATPRTLDVESEDLDPVVRLSQCRLLASIELSPLVDKLSTGGTAHVEGGHETHHLLAVGCLLATLDLGGIKVRGKVLVKYLALCHDGRVEAVAAGEAACSESFDRCMDGTKRGAVASILSER